MSRHHLILFLVCFLNFGVHSQVIEQFEVFSGRFDYTAFGNTMNLVENGPAATCDIITSSTAALSLGTNQTVQAAYLYWAGSGTGDFEVTFNDSTLVAQRTFEDQIDEDRVFFAAFVDITELIQDQGAIAYTLSDLDVSAVIPTYCPTGTNFAGWAVTVIFEDPSLPLNQVNVFDGLQSVSSTQNELNITLENLNVLDNNNARIGFVAWEGDSALAVDETLSINGNILSNPPLNPANNQFNGTNSFTGEDDLHNMDIDFYSIENNINVGDTQATIQLTSGQDFVMINNIITVLNSQLPDGIVAIDGVATPCNSEDITVTYTVTNQGTEILPAATPIAFYIDDIFVEASETSQALTPGESIQQVLVIAGNQDTIDTFTLVIIVDDDGTGTGIVIEANENNNNSQPQEVSINTLQISEIDDITVCDIDGDGVEIFNLLEIAQEAGEGQEPLSVTFFLSMDDAVAQNNPVDGENFENTASPQSVFIRFQSDLVSSCLVIIEVVLELVTQPQFPELNDLMVCDDMSNDGVGIFDLTSQNQIITNGQEELTISYFFSFEQAQGAISPIANPQSFENTENPQEIFIRLENSNAPSCVSIDSLILDVLPINDAITLPALLACNEGFEMATFDLTLSADSLDTNIGQQITGYYLNEIDAFNLQNAIQDPFQYVSQSNPQTIFIRTDDLLNVDCYQLSQFEIRVENCPPFVPEGFSPSGDGINDTFEISGLKDIFTDYELRIYSRLGNLIYEGDNGVPFWDGTPNRGIAGTENPTGVYYWVLYLNDPAISDMTGWVYLNR